MNIRMTGKTNINYKKGHILITIVLIFAAFACLNPYIAAKFISIDSALSLRYNHIAADNNFWLQIIYILNHDRESWLNVLVMLSLNIINVIFSPKSLKKQRTAEILYLWISFQFMLLIKQIIFSDILALNRLSPSKTLEGWTHLNILLGTRDFKFADIGCFPGGHALVACYWGLYAYISAANLPIRIMALATTITVCFARFFTGAHWLGDILFTIIFASWFFHLGFFSSMGNKCVSWIALKLEKL